MNIGVRLHDLPAANHVEVSLLLAVKGLKIRKTERTVD
jgi:hypothetical protein